MAVAVQEAQARTRSGISRVSPVDVILVVLALGFAALGLRPLRDPDVWWHLRTGELVVESGFTTTDPWSHASTNPWLLHEWASEVVMYAAYWIGGYRGVIVLHAVVMLGLAVIILRSVRQVSTPVVAVGIGSLALVGVFLGSAERPQLVSWCLLAAVLPALRRATDQGRAPWWLIPVVAVWANLHGLWAAALVLFAFLTAGRALQVGVRNWGAYRSFIAVGLLAFAAASLTPNGPALLLAPLHVRTYAKFVGEWNAPSLLHPFFAASYLLLAIVVVGWARNGRRVDPTQIAFVIGACLVSLPYIRTMPILAIAMAPLAAASLAEQLASRGIVYRQNTANRVLSGALVAASVVLAVLWLPQVPPVARDAPWGASAALDALPGRAKVLNEYALGGWLLWTARDTSPAIDGRTEIYSPEYVTDALRAPRAAPGWRKFVVENQFDAAWIGKRSPLTPRLRDIGWTVHYRDADSVILVPPAR